MLLKTEQKFWSFIKELNGVSGDRLDRIALISGGKKISFRKMFENWEQYAKVFSALNITEKNKSRAGLLSGRDEASVYSLYGLNMTGTSVSLLHELDILDHKRWDQLITKEGITDLILTDKKLSRSRLQYIYEKKEMLGIRNIIILHDSEDDDENYERLRRIQEILFMEDLLQEHTDTEIVFNIRKSRNDAVIFHTSGTTSGIHKPVPISDKGFNESVARLLRDGRFNSLENVVSILAVELTSAYGACDMLHLPLAYGGAVVLMPTGATAKQMLRAIKKYRVTILFAVKDLFEMLEEVPIRPDLSSLEMVFLGGSYVSPDAKKKYLKFLKACGSAGQIFVGYGMTETGGATILADGDCFEDSIGRPLSGIKVKILDENSGKYYDLSDGKHTGVLCISSPSVSSGRLNGKTFFKLTTIDDEKYLNTYDLVEADKDGSIRIIGRMNKFFVNNEGIRFDAGLIEKAISEKPGISACGLVPEYNKQIHDTVPVLYVQISDSEQSKRALMEEVLNQTFVKEDRIKDTNLPASVVISEKLPVNQMGKVDVTDIIKRGVKGKRYVIKPVRRHDKLTDVQVLSWKDAGIYTNGGIPEELEYDMELYERLLEGRQDDMSKEQDKMFGPKFFAKVVKGFLEELEEEEEKRSTRHERRHTGHRRHKGFGDLNDMYGGFGNCPDDLGDKYGGFGECPDDLNEKYGGFGDRFDDGDDDFDDDDDGNEDDKEDDDKEDDDRFRGCEMPKPKKGEMQDPMAMMSKLGRYFSASDYDKDYED